MSNQLTTEKYSERIKNKNVIPLEEYIKHDIKIKHKCLICNYEFYKQPHEIIRKEWKCNNCNTNKNTRNINKNNLWAKNIELAKLLANPEDGYKYSHGSKIKVDWKCPDCGNIIKDKGINTVNKQGLSCSICGDKISYPEKLMANILKELNINFYTEKYFDWCVFKLKNKNYKCRYDFVFEYNNQNYIIETDGGLGHGNEPHSKSEYTKEELIYVDKMKDKLAKENNYKLIRIKCYPSNFEYIKNSVMNSDMNILFDLSKIDWNECNKNSLKSKVIAACELWNSGIKSTKQIGNILKLHKEAISGYLKRCSKIGLCDYDVNKALMDGRKNGSIISYQTNKRKIICKNTNEIFNSVTDASEHFNINRTCISACINKRQNYAGKHPVTGEKLFWEYYSN